MHNLCQTSKNKEENRRNQKHESKIFFTKEEINNLKNGDDYPTEIEKAIVKIKQDCLQLRSNEINRIIHEFTYNNYAQRYNVSIDRLLPLLVGIESARREIEKLKRSNEHTLKPFRQKPF